jgi:AraC-like DNA-binding protein
MKISYERMKSARPALLWALEREWTAEHAKTVGCHLRAEENSAWLVLRGRAIVTHDGTEHEARAGEWIFPKPGERSQHFEGPFHFLSITLNWQWPDGRHLFDQGLTRVVAADSMLWLEAEARSIIEGVTPFSGSLNYYLGMSMLELSQVVGLFELGARWAGAFERVMTDLGIRPHLGQLSDPRLEQIIESVSTLPHDAPLDREALASAAGLSPRQLDRLLKEASGSTLAEHHDRLRFEAASRMLLESGKRIKEIASAMGFVDLSSFSRWFNRRANRSPREFRASFSERGGS